MNFYEALQLLKNNKKVKREGWLSGPMDYIYLDTANLVIHSVSFDEDYGREDNEINISVRSMLANDWVEVK